MLTYLLELFTVNIIPIVIDGDDIDDAVVGVDIDHVGDLKSSFVLYTCICINFVFIAYMCKYVSYTLSMYFILLPGELFLSYASPFPLPFLIHS